MFTRGQMIRRAGVTSAAALMGGLDVSVAEGMESRVDTVLRLSAGGAVFATGPFVTWDMDEVAARVVCTIVQKGNMAIGNTKLYQRTASHWATICNPCTVPLVPGNAIAYAVAVVLDLDGSSSWYTWEVPVTLSR